MSAGNRIKRTSVHFTPGCAAVKFRAYHGSPCFIGKLYFFICRYIFEQQINTAFSAGCKKVGTLRIAWINDIRIPDTTEEKTFFRPFYTGVIEHIAFYTRISADRVTAIVSIDCIFPFTKLTAFKSVLITPASVCSINFDTLCGAHKDTESQS